MTCRTCYTAGYRHRLRLLDGQRHGRPNKFGTPRVLYYLCGHGNKDTFRLSGGISAVPPAADGIMRHIVRKRGLGAEIAVDSAGTYAGHTGELARCPHAAGCVAPRLRTDAPCPADPRGGLREIRHDRGDGRPQLRATYTGWRRRVRMPPGSSVCGSFSAVTPAGIMFPDPYYEGGPRASSWCSTCWKTAVRESSRTSGNRAAGIPGGRVQVSFVGKPCRHRGRNAKLRPEIPGRSVHVPGIL